jgi:hypothetical protein
MRSKAIANCKLRKECLTSICHGAMVFFTNEYNKYGEFYAVISNLWKYLEKSAPRKSYLPNTFES